MEDRSFYWLLSLLAKKASSLDVLDTYVTLDQKPSYFYTKENSKLLTKTSENMSFNDLLHKVYQEYIWKQKVKDSGSVVCYFLHQKDRKKMYDRYLKDPTLASSNPFTSYIQLARPNSELYEIIYNLRMEYTDKGYVTKLSRVINSSLVIIESAQIFEQTCDIALTVKILIEESELKRVLILDLDIIEDIEKKLWISYTKEIKIIPPELCLNLKISVPQDLKDIPITSTKDKKLNKLVNGETKLLKSKKNQRLEDTSYIIHRGHIRNKDSIFGNTLKIIKVYDDVMNKSRFISRGTSSGYNNDFLSNTVRLNNSNSHTFENRKKAALFQEIRKDPTMKNMLRKAGFVNLIKDINQYAFKYTTKRVLDCKQLKFSKNQEIHKETLETPTSPKFIKLKIPELIRKESFRPKEIHKKIHKSPRIKLRIPNFDEALRSPEKFILSNLDTSTPNLAIEKKPTILTRSGGAQSARHMSRINSKMCNW